MPRTLARLSAAAVLAIAVLLPAAVPVLAADVTISAEPMLDGNVRSGTWSGVNVHLENSGPAIDGELRISTSAQGTTIYGIAVQLATGARQDHALYAQPGFFGGRFTVTLVSGDVVVASQEVRVTARDPYSPSIFVIAERPEGLVADVRAAVVSPQYSMPAVVAIQPEDLPPRVEAWAAIDRIVWQDIDSSRLSTEQLAALQTWVSAGGRLVIVGGTTGTTTLGAFPPSMLPFRPSLTVDAAAADVATLVGTVPGSTTVPALAGTLDRGSVMARSGDHVIAASTGYGQGEVTIVGIDPSASWIASTDTAESLWRKLVPTSSGSAINPLAMIEDGAFVASLNDLPAVDLPSIDQLFVLLIGYIALIGPVNYLVLRRLDRREWAWVTMPVLVAGFAVAAYGLGLSLKGTDVIVNELAIVRGAAGTDRGIGQAYIGIFSPTRATYDVSVAGAAFISNPVNLQQQGTAERPIDVLLGDPARLRGYQVGFGTLRGFRAEASVTAPQLDTELRLEGSHVKGSVTNRSEMALEHVGVVYGAGLQMLDDLGPGETKDVDFEIGSGNAFFSAMSERMFGGQPVAGPDAARTLRTRRMVVDQLSAYSNKLGPAAGGSSEDPIVLAWRKGGALEVGLGVDAKSVGDTVYLLPARITISGAVVFPDDLMQDSFIDSDAVEGSFDGTSFSLSHGTMVAESRPAGSAGSFDVSELEIAVGQDAMRILRGNGAEIGPLSEQPDQDDPAGEPVDAGGEGPVVVAPGGGGGTSGEAPGEDPAAEPRDDPAVEPVPPREFDGLPDVQLFDRTTGLWMEFEHFGPQESYRISEPQRYVDESGALLVRFVNRTEEGGTYFSFFSRMEGTVR